MIYDAVGFSDFLGELVDSYPIITIEDGMDESDWEGWSILSKKLGERVQLVGDELFVTNTKILQSGIDKNIANTRRKKMLMPDVKIKTPHEKTTRSVWPISGCIIKNSEIVDIITIDNKYLK